MTTDSADCCMLVNEKSQVYLLRQELSGCGFSCGVRA